MEFFFFFLPYSISVVSINSCVSFIEMKTKLKWHVKIIHLSKIILIIRDI